VAGVVVGTAEMDRVKPGNASSWVSERIRILRFPLICGVVLVHALDNICNRARADGENLKLGGADGALQALLNFALGRLSVPLMFWIAAYLLFGSYVPTWDCLAKKWANRVRSLVLPYLLWNALLLLLILAMGAVGRLSVDSVPAWVFEYKSLDGVASAFWSPVDYPLWFVRNLIVLVALAPVFYWLCRRVPWLLLLASGTFWWLSPYDASSLGRSLFWFSLGAVCAVAKPDLLKLERWRRPVIACWAVCVVVACGVGWQGKQLPWQIVSPLTAVGAVGMWLAAGVIGEKAVLADRLTGAARHAFFAYVSHAPIVSAVFKLVAVAMGCLGFRAIWLESVFVAVVTVVVCVALSRFLARYLPRAYLIATGGR
jgi:peptidoglycan/LPS O-acetylase OafA/YrhL